MSAFSPGLEVRALRDPLGFEYGPGVFGPAPEMRSLDAIRKSLRDPGCAGPDPVYAIVMDVGREEHRAELLRRCRALPSNKDLVSRTRCAVPLSDYFEGGRVRTRPPFFTKLAMCFCHT